MTLKRKNSEEKFGETNYDKSKSLTARNKKHHKRVISLTTYEKINIEENEKKNPFLGEFYDEEVLFLIRNL